MAELFGTIAKLKVKPGHLEALKALQDEREWPEDGQAMYL